MEGKYGFLCNVYFWVSITFQVSQILKKWSGAKKSRYFLYLFLKSLKL